MDSSLVKRHCQDALDERYHRRHYDYVTVEETLSSSSDWPPLTRKTSNLAELMRSESVTQAYETQKVSNQVDL